jgi:hypothetical protein
MIARSCKMAQGNFPFIGRACSCPAPPLEIKPFGRFEKRGIYRAGARITENEAKASYPAPPLEIKPFGRFKKRGIYRAGNRISDKGSNDPVGRSLPHPPWRLKKLFYCRACSCPGDQAILAGLKSEAFIGPATALRKSGRMTLP